MKRLFNSERKVSGNIMQYEIINFNCLSTTINNKIKQVRQLYLKVC